MKSAHERACFLTVKNREAELRVLADDAQTCTACPLYLKGTQTVFGAGPASAEIVFIGEQPGNEEDLSGKPFVGPAGRELDKALTEAGIDRNSVYVTNAVKHFKWEPQGKRRIHQKPTARELAACRPWLDGELALIEPKAIVCLGATAAQTILGKTFRVTKRRGEKIDSPFAPIVMATIHPSSILRQRDRDKRHEERARFIEDLKKLGTYLSALAERSDTPLRSEAKRARRG